MNAARAAAAFAAAAFIPVALAPISGATALWEEGVASPRFDDTGPLEGMGDSERIRRLLSHTGVKKPDKRSKSPTLKFFDGLEESMSLSSVVMVFPRVAHGVARHCRLARARAGEPGG